MAVGLGPLPDLLPIAGIRLAVAEANIRYKGRHDLALIEACAEATTAAIFTRNAFCAAPVIVAREHLARGNARYLLINSGNANAGTGDQGLVDARRCCDAISEVMSCESTDVLPFSTGVIGQALRVDRIEQALPKLKSALSRDAWTLVAKAIMTTDTLPKGISRCFHIHGEAVTITGIAKGAGMICPDMATLLSFVATDAQVSTSLLQRALAEAADQSFNRITVDGDTSTNDACVLIASGAGSARVTEGETYLLFVRELIRVMQTLAQAIVRDAEGATKFVTVSVERAGNESEALQVCYTVAHSPLIKTALFASDPNWGRIIAAAGRAGLQNLDVSRINLYLNRYCVLRNGALNPDYTEEQGVEAMAGEEILIRIELGRGDAQAQVWTCDLSHEYVRINAEYRS